VLDRLLLLAEAAGGFLYLARLQRPARLVKLAELGPPTRVLRAVGLAARIALALLGLSFVANLLGNLSLAETLVQGTLYSAFTAVAFQGGVLVLHGVWVVLLRTRPLRLLRGVQRYEPLLRRRGERILGAAALLGWLAIVLEIFRLRDPVQAAVVGALSANWPLGDFEISLGDLVAAGVTLWAVSWISRSVRFVLDEDVLPRAHLPRGVPYAISSAIHYVLLLLGFALAVSAAGFDMSRFALVLGALGVGIGIGLQDVVNNFVCGLILLFERPIQTGDTVQVGEIAGRVTRIGMRSSTVRTWSGSEVIVPNAKLVTDSVVNWTLSDSLRRLDVPVGVAYGTDPDRVCALLIEVAKANRAVLPEPEPLALFLAHGQSSLDFELRAWTAQFDSFAQVRSELTAGVNKALREAGIEIPYPQRDVHLRSVDPAVEQRLRGKGGG
jgi:small-conductance mechanosensitive channel